MLFLGDFMQYNKDDLEKMALVDLRLIGRAVGVKSPTSLRKNELITEILLVGNGKKTSLKSNSGRPVIVKMRCMEDFKTEIVEQNNKKDENKNLASFEKRLDRILSDFKQLILDMTK